MKATVIFLVLIATFAGPAAAQESAGHALSGAGAASCGKYLNRHSTTETSRLFTHWTQGFLSGLNFADRVSADKPFVILPDAESIDAYLDKHCKENPLSTPMEGALALYRELREATGRANE